MSRFDYVQYDVNSLADQNEAKVLVQKLETLIGGIGYAQGLPTKETERSKALAITKLEEVYMWIGKAIKEDQIARNGSAPLQEGRKNG